MLELPFRTDGTINEQPVSDICELHKNWKTPVFKTLPAF